MARELHFHPQLFTFLRQVKRHNNREWFQKHKADYELSVRDPFLRFIGDSQPRLYKISPHLIADPKPTGGSLLRIYKDLRFRPDAPPYQTMAAARFPHKAWKQTHAPGFYLHLEPGKSFLGGGLWHPDPETRARVREAIIASPSQWKKATGSKRFKAFCTLAGESLKRLPPGFDAEHLFATDLKRKDFIAVTNFTDEQVCSPDFMGQFVSACEAAAPFMGFLTRALGLPWASGDKSSVRDISATDSFQFA